MKQGHTGTLPKDVNDDIDVTEGGGETHEPDYTYEARPRRRKPPRRFVGRQSSANGRRQRFRGPR